MLLYYILYGSWLKVSLLHSKAVVLCYCNNTIVHSLIPHVILLKVPFGCHRLSRPFLVTKDVTFPFKLGTN